MCTALIIPVSADTSPGFSDISGHWAEANIINAVKVGYINGYPDGSFKPDDKVTRAEFTKMVVTALGLPVGDLEGGISGWAAKYLNSALVNRMYQHEDFAETELDTPITRLEISRMAVRGTGQETSEINKWMYLATQVGLIKGMDATGTLAVNANTTRAQSVIVIERLLALKAGTKLEVDKHALSQAEVLWHKTNLTSLLPRYQIAAARILLLLEDYIYCGNIASVLQLPNIKSADRSSQLRLEYSAVPCGLYSAEFLDRTPNTFPLTRGYS